MTYNEDLWQATIQFDQEVEAGTQPQTLQLGFNYTLSDGLSGFYRSFYKGLLPIVQSYPCSLKAAPCYICVMEPPPPPPPPLLRVEGEGGCESSIVNSLAVMGRQVCSCPDNSTNALPSIHLRHQRILPMLFNSSAHSCTPAVAPFRLQDISLLCFQAARSSSKR